MNDKQRAAAFRIKEGGNFTAEDAKLSGFDGVLDADKVGDVHTIRLKADAAAKTQRWWVAFALAVLAAVIAGLVLHYGFGVG